MSERAVRSRKEAETPTNWPGSWFVMQSARMIAVALTGCGLVQNAGSPSPRVWNGEPRTNEPQALAFVMPALPAMKKPAATRAWRSAGSHDMLAFGMSSDIPYRLIAAHRTKNNV